MLLTLVTKEWNSCNWIKKVFLYNLNCSRMTKIEDSEPWRNHLNRKWKRGSLVLYRNMYLTGTEYLHLHNTLKHYIHAYSFRYSQIFHQNFGLTDNIIRDFRYMNKHYFTFTICHVLNLFNYLETKIKKWSILRISRSWCGQKLTRAALKIPD